MEATLLAALRCSAAAGSSLCPGDAVGDPAVGDSAAPELADAPGALCSEREPEPSQALSPTRVSITASAGITLDLHLS
jgi:hypothetical protein